MFGMFTKKEREKLESFLRVHSLSIQDVAKVTHFTLGIYEPAKSDPAFKNNQPTNMTIQVDYEYLSAIVRYSNKSVVGLWKAGHYNTIISLLCHEIAHIITGEAFEKLKIKYKGDGKYYQERLTEQVGRLIEREYQNTYIPKHNIDIKTGYGK